MSSKKKRLRFNNEIKIAQVRVISNDGAQLGILSIEDGLRKALEKGLDLVEVSPNETPPVCRIMDYGRYLFEQKKRLQLQKVRQKRVQIKEIKFRLGIEERDYQIKLKKLLDFISQNYKVKVTVRYSGREIVYQERGKTLVERIFVDLGAAVVITQPSKLEGRQMVMVLSPNTGKSGSSEKSVE